MVQEAISPEQEKMSRKRRTKGKPSRSFAGHATGNTTQQKSGVLDPRVGDRIGGDAMELIQTSRVVYDRYHSFNWGAVKTPASADQLQMDRKTAQWHCAFFESYVGATDGKSPRFNLGYLNRLGKDVLTFFLPYLRRADYLHEQGKFTGVATSPDSIKVVLRSCPDEDIYCGDLLSIVPTKVPAFAYRDESGASIRVLDPSLESTVYLLDDFGAPAISRLDRFELCPVYADPTKRYYDHVTGFLAEVDEIVEAGNYGRCACCDCELDE